MLQPLYAGVPVRPDVAASFLQRPLRWLAGDLPYRGHDQRRPELRLRPVRPRRSPPRSARRSTCALAGGLQRRRAVRAETLDRFAEAFAPCGFRREAFYPCYGLAEATLIVSGGPAGDRPGRPRACAPPTLEQHRAVEAAPGRRRRRARSSAAAGVPAGQRASPSSIPRPRRLAGRAGWARSGSRGASVAQGYWGRPEETRARPSGRRLAGSGDGPFLRTGDLGFLDDGELFVTGRLKDLIILARAQPLPAGRRADAERSHPRLRPGCARGLRRGGRTARSGSSSSRRSAAPRRRRAAERDRRGDPPARSPRSTRLAGPRVVLIKPGQHPEDLQRQSPAAGLPAGLPRG